MPDLDGPTERFPREIADDEDLGVLTSTEIFPESVGKFVTSVLDYYYSLSAVSVECSLG